ncbi:hypothetical protein MTO96_007235 [Rhipicephalus appendiculatus]
MHKRPRHSSTSSEARGTRVRLLVFELQQPVVSVVARAVSWLKEGPAGVLESRGRLGTILEGPGVRREQDRGHEERGTAVRLLVFELEQPTAATVARAVSWLKEGELTMEYCHWTLRFQYPGGCVQFVNFDKDEHGYLRAEANWVPVTRAPMYEENSNKDVSHMNI